MAGIKLLFVDDDDALRTALGAVLTLHGFALTAVSSVPEALELISTQKFDVLLSDLNIGEPGDGFTVVSAMRRVQPDACTFILTGYPDLETAIQGIRSQVDDYFSKPLHIERLVGAISELRSGRRPPTKRSQRARWRKFCANSHPLICDRWLHQVMQDPELAAIPLTESERSDHVPEMMEELIRRLEGPQEELSDVATDAARKHGKLRYQQGYTIPQILREERVLQHCAHFNHSREPVWPRSQHPGGRHPGDRRDPSGGCGNINPGLSVADSAFVANILLVCYTNRHTLASRSPTKTVSSMATTPFSE